MTREVPTLGPDVSVVIPTHNRASFITDAVDSVLQQEGCIIEAIVVDDASTDGTSEILKKYGNRIRVITLNENSERGAARNIGARFARGRWIAFLDSDDLWEPRKLTRQLPLVNDSTVCVTHLKEITKDGRSVKVIGIPEVKATREIGRHNLFVGSPSSLIMTKRAFQTVGGFVEDWSLQGSEDWLFLMSLVLVHEFRIRVLSEPLTIRRAHRGSSIANPANVERSTWGAANHAIRTGLLDDETARVCLVSTATSIARQFAWQGDWGRMLHWVHRADSFAKGTEKAGLRSVVLLSGIKGRVGRYRRKTHPSN